MPIDRCIAGDIVQSARNSIGNDSGNQIPHCFWCNRALNSLLTTFLTFCVLSLAVGSSLLAKQNVLTWHNNNARTGEDLHETILTPANVKPSTFGKLFVIHVDGKVDAQPLYLAKAGTTSSMLPRSMTVSMLLTQTTAMSCGTFPCSSPANFLTVTPSADRSLL